MSNRTENADSEFFYPGEQNCLLQNYYSLQSLTPKQSSDRKTTLLTNECKSLQVYLREANNKQMPPRKQLIWMNCRIMNF